MVYYHVDVFSRQPLTGNGLSVFLDEVFPSDRQMQLIAREMKQYETIFIKPISEGLYEARIFTVDEELDFAGHPILGAAAIIHDYFNLPENAETVFNLRKKAVRVISQSLKDGREYHCRMNQGRAELIGTVDQNEWDALINPLHLAKDDLAAGYPLEICSTGLPYLLVPLMQGIEKAGIFTADYEQRLEAIGAKFVYVVDLVHYEGRTWDNAGLEDVATGSAAGPVGDYLIRHGLFNSGEEIILKQGRFLNRPSLISVSMNDQREMMVSGKVHILAKGMLDL